MYCTYTGHIHQFHFKSYYSKASWCIIKFYTIHYMLYAAAWICHQKVFDFYLRDWFSWFCCTIVVVHQLFYCSALGRQTDTNRVLTPNKMCRVRIHTHTHTHMHPLAVNRKMIFTFEVPQIWTVQFQYNARPSTYMLHQLRNHTIPFTSYRITSTILFIRHQIENIFESNFVRYPRQNINAKSEKTLISCQIFSIMHHNIWYFLGRVSNTCTHTVRVVFQR